MSNEKSCPGEKAADIIENHYQYTASDDRPVNARYEVYLAGWASGFESRQPEIDRLTWEAGLWYFCANNKGKRPAEYYTSVTDALWSEASK